MSFATSAPTDRKQVSPVCHIFCRVIDNFGDIGVCWRLARQLACEYQALVTLWLDDFTALQPLLSAAHRTQLQQLGERPEGSVGQVALRRWGTDEEPQALELPAVDVLVEGFGCNPPAWYIERMARQEVAPHWFNLEYLSAEPWVQECHGLVSLHPDSGLEKVFFFPGFTTGTGGLLRERGLLLQHELWQKTQADQRSACLTGLGIAEADMERLSQAGSLMISLFGYPSASLDSWLQALAQEPVPVLCLLPEGRLLESLRQGFLTGAAPTAEGADPFSSGARLTSGNLVLQVIPFQSQDDYDRLLSLCDLNLVRGEDSFVRAQWAGQPLVWHIYPQQEDAHLNKLEAFLDLYSRELAEQTSAAVRAFWLDWNTGADCTRSWTALRQCLPVLALHSRQWRETLLLPGDLASNLMKYCGNRL